MGTTEERVAAVEVKVESFSADIADVKSLIRALDQKLVALEQKIDRRFEAMDGRFLWVIGIQFGILVAIMASLAGTVAALLR